MYEVIKNTLIDFGIYSLFVLIYTLIGAYQNINVWACKWDWKVYLNGLVKWLALGASLIGSVFGAFLLLEQATAQGIEIVNAQAIAPRVIFGVVLVASAIILGKIIAKLSTTLGLSDEMVKQLQEQSVNTDAGKPLIFNLDDLPMPSEDYIKAKLQAEIEGGVGSFYSVAINTYNTFKNAVLGKGYDLDNFYGYQCWDGAGLLWQQLGRNLVTGNGLAIGCWDLKRDVNKYDQFDLVYNVGDLKQGDVVVMRPNHIGFFDGFDGGNMLILGQNQGGTPSNPNGGSGFNVVRISKSAFAGAFRFRRWNVVAPTPTPTPIVVTPVPTKSPDDVAKEVARGDWGNGEDRKTRLRNAGYDVNVIQAKVNILLGGGNASPAPAKPAEGFKVGDTVAPTRLVSYDGKSLKQFDSTYTISELKGDRAVLVARGTVWSAININDIRKA